jgi:hypothetical protein
MFVSASFELGVWGFRRNTKQSDLSAAQRAARSGLAYALSRLRNDPSWTANPANPLVIDEAQITVVERSGMVFGLMRDGEQTSQFRIRFNYYDGVGGGDGLGDPPADLQFDWPRVSLNNLQGSSEIEIPLANGVHGSVPATPVVYSQLPAQGTFLAVEGRCGEWLNAATAATPNPPLAPGRSCSTAHVEAVYKVSRPPNGPRAVASASGDLVAVLADSNRNHNLTLSTTNSAHVPRLRSKGKQAIYGGDPAFPNLVAGSAGGRFASLESAIGVREGQRVSSVPEIADDPFLNVSWDEVKKAVPAAQPSENVLKAGVYSVWQDGSLHYYDMDTPSYQALMAADQNDPGTTVSLPDSVTYRHTAGKGRFIITGDTFVEPTGSTDDLVFIPKAGADAGPGVTNPQVNLIPGVSDTRRSDSLVLDFHPGRGQSAALTARGKVTLGARVVGNGGSITAEESIQLIGTGVDLSAERNPKQGVSLYTKQDVLVSTYDDARVDTYKKAAFKGVIYAWGSIRMILGHADVPRSSWGKLDVIGSMVAYGKNPEDTLTPATPREIRMHAREINLKYDDSYIQSLLGGVGGNFELARVRWLQD